MSRQTVDIAREAADALGAGDFDSWLSLHSDDCEFVPLIVGVEGGEPYRGHNGSRAFWADIHGAFEGWRSEVEEVRTAATPPCWRYTSTAAAATAAYPSTGASGRRSRPATAR